MPHITAQVNFKLLFVSIVFVSDGRVSRTIDTGGEGRRGWGVNREEDLWRKKKEKDDRRKNKNKKEK